MHHHPYDLDDPPEVQAAEAAGAENNSVCLWDFRYLILGLILCYFVWLGAAHYHNNKEADVISSIKIVDSFNNKRPALVRLLEAVEDMPDCVFKHNFYVILATEYAGNGEALGEILHAWSDMQIKKYREEHKADPTSKPKME
jgi:hypothetical protein